MSVKKRLALLGVTALLALCHYMWFWLFGPPGWWGADVQEVGGATIRPGTPAFESYLHEAVQEPGPLSGQVEPTETPLGLVGTVFHQDTASDPPLSVLQTHTGRYWVHGQHLYWRAGEAAAWRELPLSIDMTLGQATIVFPNRRAEILAVRWNPWWPHSRSYVRFFLSVLHKPLRSEYGVYLINREGGQPRFMFPGSGLVPSPDRMRVAYLTSENGLLSGLHNIMVYDVAKGRSARVLSLREADPGSGTSFFYRWANDSFALVITGESSGLRRARSRRTQLRLVYAGGTLYDMSDQKANHRIQAPAGGTAVLSNHVDHSLAAPEPERYPDRLWPCWVSWWEGA